jgi:hypothetical protein
MFLVSAMVYGLELMYTSKIIEDLSGGSQSSITLHIKGRIMAGKPFPIARIGNKGIFDMTVILEPTQATISWDTEKIVLKDIEEKELFISRYQRIPSIEYLFNMVSSLLNDPDFLYDMAINKQSQSSGAFIENYQDQAVQLDENTLDRTISFNVHPIENGPVQLKRLYNFLVNYLEKRMKSQLSNTNPLTTTKQH